MSGSLATAGRLAGIANIFINGTAYMLASDLVWSPSKRTRESLVGMDRYHGFSERIVPGFITAKLRDSGALKVEDLTNLVNCDIVGELANGKTIYGYGMVCIEAIAVNAMDGTFDVRFEGPDVQEA